MLNLAEFDTVVDRRQGDSPQSNSSLTLPISVFLTVRDFAGMVSAMGVFSRPDLTI